VHTGEGGEQVSAVSEFENRYLQCGAPIVPNVGLGGLTLRRPVTDLDEIIDHVPGRYTSSDWFLLDPPYEVRYVFGCVAVAVDVRTGHIFKLIAQDGYTGMLLEKIRLGMLVADAQRVEPRLYFDEFDGLLRIRECDGVVLDVPIPDADPVDIPSMPIYAISVFAPEAH